MVVQRLKMFHLENLLYKGKNMFINTNLLYNIIFYIISALICFIIGVVTEHIINKKKSQEDSIPQISITPQSKESDLKLVFDAMDRSITKALYHFAMKDFHFSDKCKVQLYSSKNYRDLIAYLIRDDIFFTETDENGIKRDISFFSCFFQKVYLYYVSETSKNVKNLIKVSRFGKNQGKSSFLPSMK